MWSFDLKDSVITRCRVVHDSTRFESSVTACIRVTRASRDLRDKQ